MSDKVEEPEILSFEDAVAEFPNECTTVLNADSPSEHDIEYLANDPDIDEGCLVWAALKWLVGKDLFHLVPKEYKCGLGPSIYTKQIPKDFLRWLLTEVREQLERNTNAKETITT